jgi:hypothetical protein
MDRKKQEIRTFNHNRKGVLKGFIVDDDGEWITIQLVEEFEPKLISSVGLHGYKDQYEKGEQITVRKCLINELK